jgi:hypothetical protein
MSKQVAAAVVVLGLLAPLSAQRLDPDINARIREEAAAHSQIMRTLHFLTDVYGPRLTGSPSLKASGEWAIRTMGSWGLTSGHLEPWNWGHDGWVNERFSAHIISPVKDQLTAEVVAWTPGTNGTIAAQAFQLNLPDRPTLAELVSFLEGVRASVKGKIVLAGRSVPVPANLNPPPKRRDDAQVRAQFDPDRADAGQGRGRGGPPGTPPPMSAVAISQHVDDFLVASGALLRIDDARRDHGQIIVFDNRTYDLGRYA